MNSRFSAMMQIVVELNTHVLEVRSCASVYAVHERLSHANVAE